MLKAVISLIALVCAGCHRPTSKEKLLIGTWSSPLTEEIVNGTLQSVGSDVMEVTFRADHKEFWRVPGQDEHAAARWHLEGDYLVFTMETKSFVGPPGITRRERITKLTSDELVFREGSIEGRWKRVR